MWGCFVSGILPSPLPGNIGSRSVCGMQGQSDKPRAHQSSPCGAGPPHSLTHRTQRPYAVSHGHQAAGAQGPVLHSRTVACPWRGTHFQCCRVLLPPQPVGSSEVWGHALQSPRKPTPWFRLCNPLAFWVPQFYPLPLLSFPSWVTEMARPIALSANV